MSAACPSGNDVHGKPRRIRRTSRPSFTCSRACAGFAGNRAAAGRKAADAGITREDGRARADASGKAGRHGLARRSVFNLSHAGDESGCRARLKALGVIFTEAAPIDEPAGCAAPHPVTVSALSAAVALDPPAVLTCAMAEASARFVRDHAAPLARETFGAPLVAVGQASSFVCRARRGGAKLSEHAFANALDWSALTLADGTRIEVRAHDAAKEPRAFGLISTLHARACGPFATVLGPGADADHADHFHFDLAKRRTPFCQ